MATFGATASASAAASSVANNAPKSPTYSSLCHRHFYHSQSKVSFRLTPKPKLRFSSKLEPYILIKGETIYSCSNDTKGLQSSWNRSAVARAELNEVAVDGSSNPAAAAPAKSPADTKDAKSSNEPAPVATEDKISAFMSQVSGLVKLVDSRDIMELQLKQLDCELLIRKKEAFPPPPTHAPLMMAPAHLPPPAIPSSALPIPAPAAAPVATSASPSPAKPGPASASKSAKSSHSPLKCPMAGTFYRSPAPGEPAFVKVGDKVQKGQVLCIIEAMKLMNEIEADQSGTIVEIIAEDGKPVSVDTPLFVIEP